MDFRSDVTKLSSKLGYDEELFAYIAKQASTYYKPFHLVGAKTRHIDSPGDKNSRLKKLQKKINTQLLQPEAYRLPSAMKGGIKKSDFFDHVSPHTSSKTLVCMDLSNCFPSISEHRILNVWKSLGYSSENAKLLTRLTTYRGYLPQGPPTSPMLCNFALAKMVSEIETLCKKSGLNYTQYIDDINVSGDDKRAREVIGPIHNIASEHNQKIKRKKTKIQDSKHSQVISKNSKVNKKVKVTEEYKSNLMSVISSVDVSRVSQAEVDSITGKIKYVQRVSPKEAVKMRKVFDDVMLSAYVHDDGKRSKKDAVKPCWDYKKHQFQKTKCKELVI